MLKIITVPAFTDNYLWLFHPENSNQAYVVDPGDAAPIEDALTQYGLTLAGILVTHHHGDHTGGIAALTKGRSIPVFGPKSQNIPSITHPLSEGDEVTIEGQAAFKVIEVPGHTLDHIAYYSASEAVLFCGDTLFAGGCGRMFEGEPQQMQSSLAKLGSLPSETRVYCAHEYTLANLKFAQAVEPDNKHLQARNEQAEKARAQGQSTVPSTIGLELETNPFLRVNETSVINAANKQEPGNTNEPWQVFAVLRSWKDNF
ncbi:hydroxyacylglutathione hydrolase [Aestuariicella sp. G3-2]|uniref:hydroxyacylglutathione hydrolase n=1 Tax=Pseudomaricurvus albidus TaxID=2842452 RepID=UPI001C0E26EC|nr:hydroxyacylglutathione hydrolase [Aestuariicella albida]MBU3070089.1 hydroxyacylglutathione hydrolase [Aestuariicella albida]